MKAGNIATLNNTGRNFKIVGVTYRWNETVYRVREIKMNGETGLPVLADRAVYYYNEQLRKVADFCEAN